MASARYNEPPPARYSSNLYTYNGATPAGPERLTNYAKKRTRRIGIGYRGGSTRWR